MVKSSSGEAMPEPTFFVVMPSRNTETMIGSVLRRLSADVWARIDTLLVLDNASRDDTVAAAKGFLTDTDAANGRLQMIENGVDLGYGGSVKRGLAAGVASESSHVLVM